MCCWGFWVDASAHVLSVLARWMDVCNVYCAFQSRLGGRRVVSAGSVYACRARGAMIRFSRLAVCRARGAMHRFSRLAGECCAWRPRRYRPSAPYSAQRRRCRRRPAKQLRTLHCSRPEPGAERRPADLNRKRSCCSPEIFFRVRRKIFELWSIL